MGLFKRAAARGIAHELVRRGLVNFPSKQAADEAADVVADALGGAEMSDQHGHDPEEVAAIANQLIELGHALMEESGAHPAHVAEVKTSSLRDLDTVAAEAAVLVMDKAAAETGSLMHGGDAANTPAEAAKNNPVAALDEAQRPQGSYQVARGESAVDSAKGSVGDLSAHSSQPSNSPGGTNSVNADAKSAALREHIRKLAGALVGVSGDTKNTPAAAAATDDVAKLDNANRPAGYAVVGQGHANFSEAQAARVGVEQKHPNGPSTTAAGSNSVTAASKAAGLDEEQAAFVTLFRKTAEDVGAYLPTTLSVDEKIAHITHMIGFDRDGRQAYINALYKKAEGLPEMVAAMKEEAPEKKKDEKSKVKADHAEGAGETEHKDDSKKESALLERVRAIALQAARNG